MALHCTLAPDHEKVMMGLRGWGLSLMDLIGGVWGGQTSDFSFFPHSRGDGFMERVSLKNGRSRGLGFSIWVCDKVAKCPGPALSRASASRWVK